jgi:hypothetical protein
MQPIAGVYPSQIREQVVMEVWPSICSLGLGRALGRLYGVRGRLGPIHFSLLVGLVTFPLAIALYLWPGRLLRRYTLTNRRVVVRRGALPKDAESVSLGELSEVRVAAQPGQAFYNAADLELLCGDRVALRLAGVPSPESFRRTILKARDARVHVARYAQAEQENAPAVAGAVPAA